MPWAGAPRDNYVGFSRALPARFHPSLHVYRKGFGSKICEHNECAEPKNELSPPTTILPSLAMSIAFVLRFPVFP